MPRATWRNCTTSRPLLLRREEEVLAFAKAARQEGVADLVACAVRAHRADEERVGRGAHLARGDGGDTAAETLSQGHVDKARGAHAVGCEGAGEPFAGRSRSPDL